MPSSTNRNTANRESLQYHIHFSEMDKGHTSKEPQTDPVRSE